ncbi:MAG: glycosyltransferase family 39 protein, partial [Nitrososphaera sp.]
MTAIFVAFLPMQIYISQFISNEVFASLSISLALYWLIRLISENTYRVRDSLLLGLTLGLAYLSKYTGLLIVLTAGYVYLVIMLRKKAQRKKMVFSLLTCMSVVLLMAGPFYLRNYVRGGRFFHTNQSVTLEYRDLNFLINPFNIGTGVLDKFVSRSVSFVDGNYSSMWLDQSRKTYPWTRVFDSVIYYLAIFPTFLLVVGFFRALALCNADGEESRRYLPILVFIGFGLFSYVYFVFRYYSYEIVKAFYMLSQITGLAVFFVLGLKQISRNPVSSSVFLYTGFVLYLAIVSYYLLAPILIGKLS